MRSLSLHLLWIPLAVLLAAGCSREEPTADTPDVILMKSDMEYARVLAVRGAAFALEEYFAEDGIQLPMNEAPLAGKEAVLENAQRTQGISVTRTPLRAEVAASGELGYTWGSALIHVTYPNGTSTMQSAKYVTVWRKNADGQWKIVADIVNQSPVPTGT